MASQKLTALTALTAPQPEDLAYIVDDVAGTPVERKITLANLLGNAGATQSFGWSDAPILRDAANILAQRNGTNAQTFRLYNTFTDASNYERGFMRWSSNVLEIGTEAGGTGTVRQLRLSNSQVLFGTGGNATIDSDSNGLYLGGTTNTRFRSGQVRLGNSTLLSWGGVPTGTPDLELTRNAAGVLRVAGSGTGAAMQFVEMTAPAAPAADEVRIYAEDNGSGKTRLMARFATGAAQQIAIEP